MENRGKWTLYLGIFAVVVAVISIGFAYAAFSQTLLIDGEATVEKSKWQIKFDNLGSTPTLTGTAVEVTAPTINTGDTKISKFAAKFTTPGDSITYTFDVVNGGTFDAEISSLTIPIPLCTGTGANATTDASNVCKNLSYNLTYADDSAIAVGDALDAGDTKSLKLTLNYSASTPSTELPEDDVTISNLETSIIYSQK